MVAVQSDIENCCVCWTGDEFIFTPLCLYSHIADVLFVSLDDRLRSSDRLHKYYGLYHTIQFYDNIEDMVGTTAPYYTARNRDYGSEPSQSILLPLTDTLSGSIREVMTLVNDMKSGVISYETKMWYMKQIVYYSQYNPQGRLNPEVIRGIDAPGQGIHRYTWYRGQSRPAEASPVATQITDLLQKFDSDTDLFDSLAEILDLQESIKKTLHFEPYVLPGIDLRWNRVKEGHFPKYPLELFIAAPLKVMK